MPSFDFWRANGRWAEFHAEGPLVNASPQAARPILLPAHSAVTAQGRAARALRIAARSWFVVVASGQLLFATYIAGFYGRVTVAGTPERWNEVMPHGYVAGSLLFNLVLGLHLAFAFVITLGGLLQLIPAIRLARPALHRWTGRAYLVAASIMASGGLAMVWVRGGAAGDVSQHVAISINALIILVCAATAWRNARAKRVDRHRAWALRLFVAVGGVWFFRVGLMAWIVANQGPAGFDPKTFSGPFLTALACAVYMAPVGVLELYLRAQRSRRHGVKAAMAVALGVLTLVTAVGVAAATAFMWLPHL